MFQLVSPLLLLVLCKRLSKSNVLAWPGCLGISRSVLIGLTVEMISFLASLLLECFETDRKEIGSVIKQLYCWSPKIYWSLVFIPFYYKTSVT